MQHLNTERKILSTAYFASPEGRDDLYQYFTTEKSVVDMSFGFTTSLQYGIVIWIHYYY